MKTAALHNLGCKVNACETEAMRRLLEQAGYLIVDFSDPADVYVVNTCTVTQIADRKSRQMLHRARAKNPDAVIVAAGCYVESAKRRGAADDAVDIYLGNDEKSTLVEKIEAFSAARGTIFSQSNISESRAFEVLPASRPSSRVRAFLKIEDGCSQFCSYCLIPYVRGTVRSLPADEVLRQAKELVSDGCREIVLDGIHLTSYGQDLAAEENLIALLKRLNEIEGLDRIRLGSLEPDYITEETVQALSGIKKLCPHFHLSLQSGCDSVLRRMNRHYDTAAYREKCALLRQYFDQPALTTDVITGFPGETDAEFEETAAFLREISLYQIHVFPYSERQGTKASRMPDQVPGPVRRQRRDVILALTQVQQRSYEDQMLGRKVRILSEEEKAFGNEIHFAGHSAEYLYAACDQKPGEIAEGILSRDTSDGFLKILPLH